MATVITYDEPGFIGQALKINDELFCVLPTAAASEPAHQALVRGLMSGEGINCFDCGGCPVGQSR